MNCLQNYLTKSKITVDTMGHRAYGEHIETATAATNLEIIMTRTIKAIRTSEANISDRTVSYDCYQDGSYVTSISDVCDALEWRDDAVDLDKAISEIAKTELDIETLETRNMDDLDFHDLSVAGIKRALIAAYEAGKESTQQGDENAN